MPDVIIVGAGLAGTLLALESEKRGLDVLIIDDARRGAATPVAAGLITPVTGMRISPTADAERLIAEAVSVFRETGKRFGAEIIRGMPLFRGYENAEEKKLKHRRDGEPSAARWFGDEIPADKVHPALNAPLGGFMIVGGLRVDLPAFLRVTRAHFAGRLITEPFAHAELEILPDAAGVRYRGLTARHVVFAEGAAVTRNPWFGSLAWQPAKGEFITCETDDATLPDHALKLGLSAVPLGGGRWRVGSNYDWENLDGEPTASVGAMLATGFSKMFRHAPEFAVTDHGAGIRPAARGSKPIVGAHPDFPALHVFNGFGAKGCTWVPAFAREYAAKL